MYLCNNQYLIITKNNYTLHSINFEDDIEFMTCAYDWTFIKFKDIHSIFIYATNTMGFMEIIPLFLEEASYCFNKIQFVDSRYIDKCVQIYIIINDMIYIQTVEYNTISFHTSYSLHKCFTMDANFKNHISLCKYTGFISNLIDYKVTVWNPFLESPIYEKNIHPYISETILNTQLHKNSFYTQSSTSIVEYNLDLTYLIPKMICRNQFIVTFYIDVNYLYVCVKRHFSRNSSNQYLGMLVYNSVTLCPMNAHYIKDITTLCSSSIPFSILFL